MKQFKTTFLFVFALLMLTGCGDTLSKEYNKETLSEDIKSISETDSTDAQLIVGTLMRYAMINEPVEGMTYDQLLEKGRQYKVKMEEQAAEEKRLAEEAKVKEQERIDRLNNSLTVSLFDKGFNEQKYDEHITYKFAFNNKTEKDIRAFRGLLLINDLFDKEIYQVTLTYDEGVPAGQKVTYNATTDYNKYMDSHQALRSKTLDKLKVVWKPEKILFADGSSLE